jgi:hypothetical protein
MCDEKCEHPLPRDGNNIIANALQWLHDRTRPANIEVNGKSFRTGDYVEVKQDPEVPVALKNIVGDVLKLGTCGSLIEFLNHGPIREQWSSAFRLVVNRDGIVAYLDDASDFLPESQSASGRHAVVVPFIKPWERRKFSFEQLKEFFDAHAGKVKGEEELRSSIKCLTLAKREEIKIEDKGAFTQIQIGAGKNLENQNIAIPKEIVIALPTGTREFEIEQRFLFRVFLDGPSFELIHIENDGSWEELLKQAVAVLRTGIPNDLIVEGV